jgi:aspartyl-tRNA(Asn)/glutamyl-tRNA(Gln) amidotransferase subunit A
MPSTANIRTLATQLMNQDISCEQLIKDRLEIAKQCSGVFVSIDEQDLLESAIEIDKQRSSGNLPSLAGVPITLKDLFDVKGQKTLAASKVLADKASSAAADAEVVAPLREAGMLFLGRTNMSEFAFSGMGLNPHYPPLYSVWDETNQRLPGGSSSGSAVSVAKGIVPGTLGSDTTGSCRIPAAFNGIVGMKPSRDHLSLNGIYPLSHSCDAPGPLAVDVDSCYLLYEHMQGKQFDQLPILTGAKAETLHLLIPEGIVMQDLDPEVSVAFEASVERLKAAGIKISRQPVEAIEQSVDMFFNRNTVIYEAWHLHKDLMESHGEEYDPYVYQRVFSGKAITKEEQESRYAEKADIVERFNKIMLSLNIDALIYPTVPCIPPKVTETDDPDNIGKVNLRCLRNTSSVNYVDGCAISLPCHKEGEAPVGLMLSSVNGDDDRLLSLAATVESILQSQ